MKNLWNPEDQRLLERLNKDILSGPTLERPDSSRRFYTKRYWSKDRIGVVLMQADVSEESEAEEKYGGKCEFEKSLLGMRLRPIYFISKSTVSTLENSRNIFVGDAASVRWDIGKF